MSLPRTARRRDEDVSSSQLHVEALPQSLVSRRRRLADQSLEALTLGLVGELAGGIVKNDRQPAAAIGLALHEDQLTGSGALLPVDSAPLVTHLKAPEIEQLVAGSPPVRRAVAEA